jgi:WD40 repeat protein
VRLFAILACFTIALAADEPQLIIDSGGHQATIRFVAFTHDGKYLVSAGEDKVIRIWDVASGQTVRTIRSQVGDGDEGKIYAVALSPDGRYLAVGGYLARRPDAGLIRIHNLETGEVVGSVLKGHTDVVTSLAFSPDGRYLASSSLDESVRVWDVRARKVVKVLAGHRDSVYAVAFSPDGRRLVSGSLDKTLRLWDAASGTLIKEMTGHLGEVNSAIFSPDGRYIASGSDDPSLRLWDGKTGEFRKQLASIGGGSRGLSFSTDNRWLLTGTGNAGRDAICHVFEVSTGREISSFSEHKNVVLATAFAPDGHLVSTAGGNQNEIDIWDPATAQPIRKLVGAGQTVWSVAFGGNGPSLA